MAKKRFLVGMLVLALVFGMMVIGCEEEETEYMYAFINKSSYSVEVRYYYSSSPNNPDEHYNNIHLSSGQTQAVTSYDTTMRISYYSPTDKVLITYDIDKRTFTFTDRP